MKTGKEENRPTPETDANIWASISGCIRGQHGEPIERCYVPAGFARNLERQRDEARERCNINAKQLLDAVNDRNRIGVQLDLLRDEFRRIEARIGESGLGDNPYLSHIADYCQRAQKDIAVRYTPIEERDRACERLSVVSLQLDDCKAQRDRLLAAGNKMLSAWLMPEDAMEYSDWVALSADAKAAWYQARDFKP